MKNKKRKRTSNVEPYEVDRCEARFITDDGVKVIGYDFDEVIYRFGGESAGADTIMDLAKKVQEYLAGLCILELNRLDAKNKLASPIVDITCTTKTIGWVGFRFSIMCDYSPVFDGLDSYDELFSQFRPVLYVGDSCIGELFKYAKTY